MDTGKAYEPEYVLYRARTRRPQVEFGAGLKLAKRLCLGAGVDVAFSDLQRLRFY